MKKNVMLAAAVVLSLGLSPIVTSFAAMGYGGGGGGGGTGYGGGGGSGGYKAEQTVRHCRKGEVRNNATHKCVKVSSKAHKSYRPSGMY